MVALATTQLHAGQFVVDTGTSIIVGPNNRVGPLIEAVNKSTGYKIAADGTMDCELEASVPTLGFEIDVRAHSLTHIHTRARVRLHVRLL